jgi:hypothetical protein
MTDVETGTGAKPDSDAAEKGAAVQPSTQPAGEIPAVTPPQVEVPKIPVPEVPVPVMTPQAGGTAATSTEAATAGTATVSTGARGEGRDAGRGDGRGDGRGGDDTASSGAETQPASPATGDFARDLAGGSGGGQTKGGNSGAQLMRQLLIEHLKVAALQSGYAQVTQALPRVLAAGIEAGQRKKAADLAYEEGLAVAVKVLTSARDAARNLSSSIQGEQETMAQLLANNEELVKLTPDAVKALSVMEQIGHSLATQKAGTANPTVRQGLQFQIEQIKQQLSGASR